MIYLLGYWGEDKEPDFRVALALHAWKKNRSHLPKPNYVLVPPGEEEHFKKVAAKEKLEVRPDQEFKIRHGAKHFGLNYDENLKTD